MAQLGGFTLQGNPKWFHVPWPPHWRLLELGGGPLLTQAPVSSTAQEGVASLIATIIATQLEARVENPHQLLIWTDSQALIGAIAKGRSSSPRLNEALMLLQSVCAASGTVVQVAWHGRDSCLAAKAADALSHGDLQAATGFIPGLGDSSRVELPLAVTDILQDRRRSSSGRA